MDIPDYLVKQIAKGWAVLLLGAGASLGARNSKGEQPLTGQQLTVALSKEFLGGRYAESSLDVVSQLAIAASDLVTVQEHIRFLCEDYSPADFHLLLPTFRWHGIATTNYDLLIETAYDKQPERVQNIVPIRGDCDRVDELLKRPDSLALVKLHGCITRTHEVSNPLILTPEQYRTHRAGRSRLYLIFKEWAYEHPIIFMGHALQDPDIRQILSGLDALGDARPAYYMVAPNVADEERRFFESKKICVLEGTLEEFLVTLNSILPRALRYIKTTDQLSDHPIVSKLATTKALSEPCINFVKHEVEYVHAGISFGNSAPQAFYRGHAPGWAAVAGDLDVRRELVDTILLDVILADESDRPMKIEFYVVKAEAGAGKSICLKRIAWDAAIDYEKTCLYVRPYDDIQFEPLREISNAIKERIFLFIDDAADNVRSIERLIIEARAAGLPLTIISAERINEWNVGCEERLGDLVTETYKLDYLTPKEIDALIALLETHDSLGHLVSLTPPERRHAFTRIAGRQLLVALHEATLGKRFEDILVDEYHEIRPAVARSLYLSVCVLNRLRIPVRAGLISRVHGIAFTAFEKELFQPLEHVVNTSYNPIIKDYAYAARHPEIANIVFQRILTSPEDRFKEYTRMLSALNIAYASDRKAFRNLIKGRTLLDLFPNHDAVVQIYKLAFEIAPDEPYLLHQRGLYEMRRKNGNLTAAHEFLAKAAEIDTDNPTIIHSLAELAKIRADKAQTDLEKERYRQDAAEIAFSLINRRGGAYGFHTLLKISLDRLRELLAGNTTREWELRETIEQAEKYLARALQMYPGDEYLLTAESDLGQLIRDEERALRALVDAFHANKRSPFIANRLARIYHDRDNCSKAIHVLEIAIDANRGEQGLHYALSKMLIDCQMTDSEKLLYHLRRAFTPGDRNHDAQFWYARYLFESLDKDKVRQSKEIFGALRNAPIPPKSRKMVRDIIVEGGAPKVFRGTVAKREASYAFIERDGMGDWIFTHKEQLDPTVWSQVKSGRRVHFHIGFNFGGPIALEIGFP